jgi:glycerol-1-phosphate dehydrogenase [NAD(P)+]
VIGETIGHRSVRIPKLLRLVESRRAMVEELASLGRSCRFLVVHSGDASPTGYGRAFIAEGTAAGLDLRECVARSNTEEWADVVGAALRGAGADYVVGIGGGRVVDVAKVAAARAEIDFISVPTQASSDGMCSPVAVMQGPDGRPRSLGARIPVAVVVDMSVLLQAPLITWRSGLGDLISNLSAVEDWRLAHALFGEPLDDFACLTAEAAALSVYQEAADIEGRRFREKLVRGVILSGISMEMAGSSRPASGSEHLISHALDRLLPEPRLHGLQVALGTITAFILRGEDIDPLVGYFRGVGLPVHPADLGIDTAVYLEAVRTGKALRPGRTTVLDRIGPGDVARLKSVLRTLDRTR